jgi:predicted dinucleotide-binding enzyme
MKIAIIGHGNVGGALARNWAGKGHDIIIGARNPEDSKVLLLTDNPHISATTIPNAVKLAEVVLVATPAHAAVAIADQLGDMTGKVLIDATNAVTKAPEPYPTAFDAFRKLTRAELAKCFNTTGFENMENPYYGDQAADMFVAGDSVRAKEVATQLAKTAGFAECYDFGGDDRVEALEKLAYAWINLAIFQGLGRDMAFKVLRR